MESQSDIVIDIDVALNDMSSITFESNLTEVQ